MEDKNMIKEKVVVISVLLIAVIVVSFVISGCSFLGNGNREYKEFANNYFNIMKEIKTEWKDCNIYSPVRLISIEGDALLYRVIKDGEQKGYFTVADINGEISIPEATFSGYDKLIENPKNKYYVPPFGFYNKTEFITNFSNFKFNSNFGKAVEASTTSLSNLIYVPTSYGKTEYSSFHSMNKVLNVPEYYNYFLDAGCAPASGAMLISFYDREILPNLYSGTLPITNLGATVKGNVENFIDNLANNYMYTNPIYGASTDNIMSGLDCYFRDKGYNNYYPACRSSYADFSNLILNRNPAVLTFICGVNSNGENLYHSVLGLGIMNVRYSGCSCIVYTNLPSSTGEQYIDIDLIYNFIYMCV